MKNPRRVLFLIIVLTITAIFFDLPDNYPLKIHVANFNWETTLNPLKINVGVGNNRLVKIPKTVLGLDLAGGAHLVYEASMSGIASVDQKSALDAARNIIEKRVNLFGVSEPIVQTSKIGDSHRVIVELPGVADVSSAKDLIGKTAQLDFREFLDSSPSAQFLPLTANTKSTGLTGKDLARARVDFNSQTGEPQVALEFTAQGGAMFADITKRLVGQRLPVFLDEQPVTNPEIREVIPNGTAVISGGFTQDDAKNLAIQLNSGALPVPINIIEEKSVGPTLGKESIDKSIRAGIIGLGFVMVFMWLYYGKLGFLADIALIIYGVISYAIFRLIPITLTLPGIAGFILSIGMAVDSNILIFERIKEESRSGKKWQAAMEVGFGRAWDSIRDANVTTLLTSFILFNPLNWSFLPQFGVARGFAATLALGIFVSLFTGIVVSRNLIRVFIRKT